MGRSSQKVGLRARVSVFLLLVLFCQAKLDSMSQVWTEKDKRSDGIEEELELVGSSTDIYSSSSSETANQVPLTTCAAVQSMKGSNVENDQYGQ